MRFAAPLTGVPDAVIRDVEALPARLAGGTRIGPCVEVKPGGYLLNMSRVARVLVSDGQTIDVQQMRDADPELVALILDMSARAALIQQRGELALEATTMISPNGEGVALCGHSGLGKSTIAAALSQRGWLLAADGITRAVLDATGPMVWPSHLVLKLWRNACESLSIDPTGLQAVRSGLEKFFVPVPATVVPASLNAIIWLSPESETRLIPVLGDMRLPILSDCTYRVGQIASMGREAECTRTATGVAEACKLLQLQGARKRRLPELVEAVAEVVQ